VKRLACALFFVVVLLAEPILVAQQFALENFRVVSTRRASLCKYDYTYTADVTNKGDDAENVSCAVNDTVPKASIGRTSLTFGGVDAGATVTSTNTFTLRQHRRFKLTDLRCDWSSTPVVHSRMQAAGPKGARLRYPGGLVLDIPIGALPEATNIEIKDLSADQANAVLAAHGADASHPKRYLGGFGVASPVNFKAPVKVIFPISTLKPKEIPIPVEFDLAHKTYRITNDVLTYYPDKGLVELELKDATGRGVIGVKRPDFGNPTEPKCCAVFPPNRPAGCECCTERTIEVRSKSVDLSSKFHGIHCTLTGDSAQITFRSCRGSPTVYASLGSELSHDCPKDVKVELSIKPPSLDFYVCDERDLHAAINGYSLEGVLQFPTNFVDWRSDRPDVAAVHPDTNSGSVAKVRGVSGGPTAHVIAEVAATNLMSSADIRVQERQIELPASKEIKRCEQFTPVASLKGLCGPLEGNVCQMKWSSDKPEAVAVDPTTGLITGVDDGTAVITATLDKTAYLGRIDAACARELQATMSVHVTDVAITINPSSKYVFPGDQFMPTVSIPGLCGSPEVNICHMKWSSDKPEVAAVDLTTGLITGVGDGTAVITATLDTACGQPLQAAVEVHVVVVASVEIDPSESILGTNASMALHAILRDTSGNPIPEFPEAFLPVHWTSSDHTIVSLWEDSTGTYNGANAQDQEGSVTITAEARGKVGTATIRVNRITLVTIAPARAATQIGNSVVFAATAKDAQGNVVVPEPSKIHWSIDMPSVATLTPNGMQASALAKVVKGLAQITVKIDGASPGITVGTAIAVLEVRPKVITVEVIPKRVAMPIGTSYKFTVVGKDADGNVVTQTADSWSMDYPCEGSSIGADGTYTASTATSGCAITAKIDDAKDYARCFVYDTERKIKALTKLHAEANYGCVNGSQPIAMCSNGAATATATALFTPDLKLTVDASAPQGYASASAAYHYSFAVVPSQPIPDPPDKVTVTVSTDSACDPAGWTPAHAYASITQGSVFLGKSPPCDNYPDSADIELPIGGGPEITVSAGCGVTSYMDSKKTCSANITVFFSAPPGYKVLSASPPIEPF